MKQGRRRGLAQIVDSKRDTPSFAGRSPASDRAHCAAQGASKKKDTKCELELRRALWADGLRYRTCVPGLAGRPDIVFPRERVAVFCDGDFWHGRDLEARLTRLAGGHNAPYWVEKIRTNVLRDRATTRRLRAEGWTVPALRVLHNRLSDARDKEQMERRRLDPFATDLTEETRLMWASGEADRWVSLAGSPAAASRLIEQGVTLDDLA